MKKVYFSTLMLLAVALASAQNNQTLPDLTLKDINGKNKNVADYGKSGKITVISFWATWCTPCKKELTNINDNLLEEWRTKYNVQLVAVSTDNSKNVLKVKPFVDGQGWDFDCLLDVNEDLKRAINATIIPHTLLIDQNGKIVWTHTGYVEGDEFILEEQIKKLVSAK
jgi:cytochrome c biogenesis protein CcmG/thiol:disulfide interchange protein DsbE